jgi:hypothetical protein
MQSSFSSAHLDALLKKQNKSAQNSVALNRSSSVSVGIGPSTLNRIETTRRTYYEAIPFTTVHGLQFKEHQLHKVRPAPPSSLGTSYHRTPSLAMRCLHTHACAVCSCISLVCSHVSGSCARVRLPRLAMVNRSCATRSTTS